MTHAQVQAARQEQSTERIIVNYYVNSETHGVWYAPEHRADRGAEIRSEERTTVLLDPRTQDPDGRENRRVALADTVVIQLPKAFYEDHVARSLVAGNVEHETSRAYEVRMDRVVFDELVSDASSMLDYFRGGAYEPEMIGLAASARATLKRLRAATVPWETS